MKILSVYYTHKPGGFCRRLYRVLNACSKRGHEVHYFTLDPVPEWANPLFHVHRIPFPTARRAGLIFWLLFLGWTPWWLAWNARRIEPDRYTVFGAFYSALVAVAAFVSPAPTVLFLRGLVFRVDALSGKPKWLRWIINGVERVGISRADTLVCLTSAMAEEISRFSSGKHVSPTVLPNDVPTLPVEHGQLPLNLRLDGKLVIVTSAVLGPGKNLGYLLAALSELPEEVRRRYLLLIAGEGLERPALEQESVRRGIADQVLFLGWCTDLSAFFSRADLVVHPSLSEGMPNAILEAMAFEVPVFASDTPELRELLSYRELLFDPQNPAELAHALKKVADGETSLSHLRALIRERRRVFTFDWDGTAAEIVEGRA